MAETAAVPSWVVCAILRVARDFPFTKTFLTRLKNRAASLGVNILFGFGGVNDFGDPFDTEFVFRCQEISSDIAGRVNPEHERAANDLLDVVHQHVNRNWRRCPSNLG